MKTNMAASVYENKIKLCLILSAISIFFVEGAKDQTEAKIYYDIEASNYAFCFKRFNATHEIGCRSSRRGNVGAVHHVETTEDIDWLMQHGPHQPYIVVLDISLMNRTVIQKLVASEKVNGIALLPYNDTDIPLEFSPDTSCPNDLLGLYHGNKEYEDCKKSKWNEAGNGLMFDSLPFPLVVLSNSSDADFILQCYAEHNKPIPPSHGAGVAVARGYPLCAMKLSTIMDGAKDTPTCIRRSNLVTNLNPHQYCDPLGNNNVYAYMDSLNTTAVPLENNSVIVVAARLDSFSMFDGMYPGVDSAVMSFVAVHSVAETLGKVKEELGDLVLSRPVLFILFHGEAFDYIGSGRFVYDMIKGSFLPVTIDHIGALIEIGQIGLHDDSTVYLHTDPLSKTSPETAAQLSKLTAQLKADADRLGLKMSNASDSLPLPPASAQSFLKIRPHLPTIVITNHNDKFTNKHYNSMFDDVAHVSGLDYPVDPRTNSSMYDHVTKAADQVAKVATTVARLVYQWVKQSDQPQTEHLIASNETVTNLLYCFAVNPACEILNQTVAVTVGENYINNKQAYLSRYVGVAHKPSISLPTLHHYSLMLNWLGTPLPANTTDKECKKLDETNYREYHYVYINGVLINDTRQHVCMRGAVNVSLAVSPAFEITDYDWSSNKYSSWTESIWPNNAFEVRVFLLPQPSQELVTLIAGIVVFVVSLIIWCIFERRSRTSNPSLDGVRYQPVL